MIFKRGLGILICNPVLDLLEFATYCRQYSGNKSAISVARSAEVMFNVVNTEGSPA